jgi:hypothetical protein
MEYAGLSDDDLNNVQALNRLFLDCLKINTSYTGVRDQLALPLGELVSALSEQQLERLSASPFLLFSLREQEGDFWEALFEADCNGDLFVPSLVPGDETGQLLSASLGFLWQLAGRNAYAVRVLSGASLHWCEQLADCTLVTLLSRAAYRADLLVPRFSSNPDVWTKLLSAGVSSERNVRHAAHLTALQTLLTQDVRTQQVPARAAACRLPPPRSR